MTDSVKVPAYEAVAAVVRRRILAGELRPGQRLPSEAELIEDFGFSRSTIREAMRTLASENLVYTTRGTTGGTFVAVPDIARITARVEHSVALMAAADAVTVDQLMDVRALTEVHAAGTAAHRRTEEQLAQMRESVAETQASATYEANQEFHMLVLHAAGNPMLELICAPVFGVLSGRFVSERTGSGFWQSSQEDHRRILAAIEEGDSMAAMTQMRRHLDRISDEYKRMDLLRTLDPDHPGD